MNSYTLLLVLFTVVSTALARDVELSYFGIEGRLDSIRMLLSYGGIPFKETRLNPSQIAKIQKERKQKFTEFLRVDKTTVGSIPIITRYIARLAKLDYANDKAHHDQLVKFFNIGYEFFQKVDRYVAVASGQLPGDKDAEYRDVLMVNLHKYMSQMEVPLRNNKNGMFSPRGLTYVDLFWASLTDWLQQQSHAAMSDYPTSLKHRDEIFKLAKLQKFLKNRKV